MTDAVAFLTVMAAMSASVQTLVEHVIKKNVKWLDEKNDDPGQDRLRHVAIHVTVFLVGGALALSVGATPLIHLGVQGGVLANAAASGVLVSFGGSFFDEALGAVREFKKAQEKIRGGTS
jgi:hypothetical protein